MNIRTATINDTKAIMALWKETKLTRPWNSIEDDIKRALATPTSTLLVMEYKSHVIGTVMPGYDGHRGWFYYLAVDPLYQGNGFGKQLVHAAEEWLKLQGAPKVLLMVRKSNESVVNFYTNIGYEENNVMLVGKWLEENVDVPSPINFHNLAEAEEWVINTKKKRPYRHDFFIAFAQEINANFKNPVTILEIGSGPGHLARHILENCNVKKYMLLDFSAPMNEIARNHLGNFANRATFLKRNFKAPDWYKNLEKVDIVVTLQAVHEVRHKKHIGNLFKQLRHVLREDGMLLYSDHYYTEDNRNKHPELYLTLDEQSAILTKSGFHDVELLLDKGEMALYRAIIKTENL